MTKISSLELSSIISSELINIYEGLEDMSKLIVLPKRVNNKELSNIELKYIMNESDKNSKLHYIVEIEKTELEKLREKAELLLFMCFKYSTPTDISGIGKIEELKHQLKYSDGILRNQDVILKDQEAFISGLRKIESHPLIQELKQQKSLYQSSSININTNIRGIDFIVKEGLVNLNLSHESPTSIILTRDRSEYISLDETLEIFNDKSIDVTKLPKTFQQAVNTSEVKYLGEEIKPYKKDDCFKVGRLIYKDKIKCKLKI